MDFIELTLNNGPITINTKHIISFYKSGNRCHVVLSQLINHNDSITNNIIYVHEDYDHLKNLLFR